MMLVALGHRLSIVEIPVTFRPRVGESKGASQSFWKKPAVYIPAFILLGIAVVVVYRKKRRQ